MYYIKWNYLHRWEKYNYLLETDFDVGAAITCIYSGVSVLIMKLRSEVVNSISSYFGWRKGRGLAFLLPTLQNFSHSL
jgi:hypothetical protein